MLTYHVYLKQRSILPLENTFKTKNMKKILLSMLCVLSIGALDSIQAQNEKKIEKEIQVEETDGNTTITVTEKEGGKVTTKVYSGKEAEEFLETEENGKAIFISEEGEGENIFIMKMSGDEDQDVEWITEQEMKSEFSKMDEELEELRSEMDKLTKEEIAEKLDEIMEMRENSKEIHIVKIQKEMDDIAWTEGETKVEVEEVDGVMTITKTTGDSKTVKEIKMDEGNNQKQVYVIKTSGDKDEAIHEMKVKGASDDLEVSVKPGGNKSAFTINLNLRTDETANVKVMDSTGKEVYSRAVQGIEKHSLDVKVKKPTSGSYVIEVVQGNKKVKLKTDLE
jgi:hypothetical protein